MEKALFTRLWQELDFDDHPYPGSHSPEPQGDLKFTTHDGALTLADDRISFRLGVGEDGEKSIHRWTMEPTQMNEGPERLGEHRWSICPKDLGLTLSAFVAVKMGPPTVATGDSKLEERLLLGQIRNSLSPLLTDWTWHLEVDNKPDRMGWYIRAPEAWESLFTVFAGLGWHPDTPENKHGFLLFERAPPGELDRPDEEGPNRLDALRSVALCNSQRGALTKLASDPVWSHESEPHHLENLPGDVQLWPPSMGRWPLLVARQLEQSNPLKNALAVAQWQAEIVGHLEPAISTLSTKIDGLSWQ
jgi:hypothetical protein